MAQIGTFTRTKHGFTGRLRTLSLDIELTIVPAEHSDAENAPNYRIHAGDKKDLRSARAGDGPERKPASMSRCRSTIRSHEPLRADLSSPQPPLRIPPALDPAV